MAGLVFTLILLLTFVSGSAFAQTSLTLDERIQARERIESVYYKHRIWPESNNRKKPTFDQLVPRKVIEQKVLNSLTPVSRELLQAEMDRIARETQNPSMLRELFAALNNDAFLVAEIIARPILVDRNQALTLVSKSDSQKNFRLPKIRSGVSCEGWEPLNAANPPSPRSGHTAIWTGTEMIIWGGGPSGLNTGARYDPTLNTWIPTSTGANVPTPRFEHSAIWTGTAMIVWGGHDADSVLNTGSLYDPVGDTWSSISTGTNVPDSREDHTAVWTGTEMIVWGGVDSVDEVINTGGRYDPSTDTWQPTSTALDVPDPRYYHSAIWTGNEMIVWGGLSGSYYGLSSGARYNPASDTWTATSATNAPEFRFNHTAIWTGNEMVVWGGRFNLVYLSVTNTGGRYNPITNVWQPTETSGSPLYRNEHTAVWTGEEMIVWSGNFYNWNTKTGGRYTLSGNSWSGTAFGSNVPSARSEHTAIWTGNQMIIFGGSDAGSDFDTGGIYTPDNDPITLTPNALPNAEYDTPYFQTLSASGGTPNYSMSITEGTLPTGLTLDSSTGVLSGIPIFDETAGSPIFAVTATDENSCAGSQSYYFAICNLITFSPPSLPDGEVGVPYNQTITPSGGLPFYNFSITSGSLPAGLTLDETPYDSTVISGIPTTEEVANFTITAVDVVTCAKSKDYTITIGPPCLLCDDFEDGVEDPNWTEVKPAWSESGGSVVGTPNRRRATIVASPIFSGCQNCSEETTLMTAGGAGNILSLLGWYLDKDNHMELQLKEESDKIILKQKVNGVVVAKARANFTIVPNTSYLVRVNYDGTNFAVSVNGSQLFTLTPAAPVPIGTIGFQVKRTIGSFDYITVN